MSGIAELLAGATESAPVQRVRNYYLTDREAVPRAEDFLAAMKRTGGALCVRWAGPPGECFVRYAAPGWERAAHDRFRGRTTVESVDADRVRRWLRNSRPELVVHDEVRASFEPDAPARGDRSPRAAVPVAADGGSASTASGGSSELRSDGGEPERTRGRGSSELCSDGGEPDEPRSPAAEIVRVRRRADLSADPALARTDVEAIAAALPAGPGERVFWLPLELAEETVLASTARSDRVFVGEVVPDRETDHAYYVRQGRRGGWIPKGEARVYEIADRGFGEGAERGRESA